MALLLIAACIKILLWSVQQAETVSEVSCAGKNFDGVLYTDSKKNGNFLDEKMQK